MPACSLPVRVAATTRGSLRIAIDLLRTNQQGLKRAFGESGFEKNRFNGERALGDVRGVLQQSDVAGHKAGAAKRKTCQKGKFQGITARIGPMGR